MSSPLSRYVACDGPLEDSFEPSSDVATGRTRDAAEEIKLIAPPVPAPYLADAPALPRSILATTRKAGPLSDDVEEQVSARVYTLAALLRFRRERYEEANRVQIIREQPPGLY